MLLYTMSAYDVTRTIHDALATEQKQTKSNGDDTMSTNNTNQYGNAMNEMNQEQALQKIPTAFNVYDPNTGRNWSEDAQGRRIARQNPISGTQLVNINSRITQLNNSFVKYQQGEEQKFPFLKEHSVRQMSIDSASVMIDLLAFVQSQFMMIEQGYKNYQENRFAEYEHKIQVLTDELDSALKDPKVAAEMLMLQQAARTKKDK